MRERARGMQLEKRWTMSSTCLHLFQIAISITTTHLCEDLDSLKSRRDRGCPKPRKT